MSRSEQERREQEARRARRLAERAEQRAERKAEQARRAAERAEQLAERARRRPRRDKGEHFEDKWDRMAEKWEKQAEAWFEAKFDLGGSDDSDLYGFGSSADEGDDGMSGEPREQRTSRSSRRRERAERAREAEERRRRRRRSRRRSQRGRTFGSRLRSGQGLYRDKERAKICGVCAGVADYFDVETWQVRLGAVLGLIFVPSFAVPAYFIAYFLMDDKPYYKQVTDQYPESELDEGGPESMSQEDSPNQPDQPGVSNAEAFRQAKQKFADIEERLRSMESHVTSSRFELQRELRKISGDDA